jgi:hypothetical protein
VVGSTWKSGVEVKIGLSAKTTGSSMIGSGSGAHVWQTPTSSFQHAGHE